MYFHFQEASLCGDNQRSEIPDRYQINDKLMFHSEELGLLLRPKWTVQVSLHPGNKQKSKYKHTGEDQTTSKKSPKTPHPGSWFLPFSLISTPLGEVNLHLTSLTQSQLSITFLLY